MNSISRSNAYGRNNSFSFTFKSKLVVLVYVFIAFHLLSAVRDITSIYSIKTSAYIFTEQAWLNFSLSLIEIPAIFFFLFLKPEKHQIDFRPILFLVLLKDFLRLFFQTSNIFDYNDFSILITCCVGSGCYIILTKKKFRIKFDDILDLIIVLNFITQIIFVITGRRSSFGGRYGALGSDNGTVGTMCCHYFLYYLFARKTSKRPLIPLVCCILSLFLSGSRTNLVLLIVFTIIFSFKIKNCLKHNKRKAGVLIFFGSCLVLLIPFLLSYSGAFYTEVAERMKELVDSLFSRAGQTYFANDDSLSSRLVSFDVGFSILSENWFGLSSSPIDLQQTTINFGYPTFPHSTAIVYYLLFGPVTLFIFGYLFYLCFKLIRNKDNFYIPILCIIVSFVIYGAPIVVPKTWFWYMLLFGHAKERIISHNRYF